MLEILLISGVGLAVAISIAAAIAPREPGPWLAGAPAHPWPFARDLAGGSTRSLNLPCGAGFRARPHPAQMA
jgi:hypothetical protein